LFVISTGITLRRGPWTDRRLRQAKGIV